MSNLKLYYYNDRPNFGDQLSAYIIEKMFNCKVVWSTKHLAQLCAIGSILDHFLDRRGLVNRFFHPRKNIMPPIKVWGSGFIEPPKFKLHCKLGFGERFKRDLDIRAVRGLLTLARVERTVKGDINNLSLGDPALLISLSHGHATCEKSYRLGIVPHFHELKYAYYQNIANSIPDSIIIDVTKDPLSVVEAIRKSEKVISSSLHGLIVADSFGIPNQWVVASDLIEGGRYKFDDYYSIYSIDTKPIDLRISTFSENDLNAISDNYQIDHSKIKDIQRNLLYSFPVDIISP